MKAYVYAKHRTHPQPNSQGMQRGDVCYIYPINPSVGHQGNLTLRTYVPIVIDLNIPCGQGEVAGMNWNSLTFRCPKCPKNDPLSCDVNKYRKGKWSAGDIKDPPKLIKKRIYKIDIDSFLSEDSKVLVERELKNDTEKALVYANSKKNEQSKTLFREKQ